MGAARCANARELHDALRLVRVVITQSPPLPQQRFAERLAQIGVTERDAAVKQRVGQELFREMLLDYWDGACAVTGITEPRLLRASHAKPWKDATDTERLDTYNGVLLAVYFDALFDSGLMTFGDDGTALFSGSLLTGTRSALGIVSDLRLRRVATRHAAYFDYHRRFRYIDSPLQPGSLKQ